MNKYFICCEECFEKVGRENTSAARMWMDLCAYRCAGYTLHVEEDCEALKTLELLGFVISTDEPTRVCVKLRGCMETDEGQPFFCAKEGNHE